MLLVRLAITAVTAVLSLSFLFFIFLSLLASAVIEGSSCAHPSIFIPIWRKVRMCDLLTYMPEVFAPLCEPSRLSNVSETIGGAWVTSYTVMRLALHRLQRRLLKSLIPRCGEVSELLWTRYDPLDRREGIFLPITTSTRQIPPTLVSRVCCTRVLDITAIN